MPNMLAELGAAMLLSLNELTALVRSAPRRYKVYTIPKRTPNKFRIIAQPAREVKALQYWAIRNILEYFPVHPSATGYRKGLNIADNVAPHVHSTFLLKLDFSDFFPSIKARDFRLFAKTSGRAFDEDEIEALVRILFWKPKGTNDLRLSIGAPSSPMLSNILMMKFDEEIAAGCARLGVVYTRYADDLSFSARRSASLQEVEQMVTGLCNRLNSPALTLNPEKTVRVSKRESRRVTGLVISNESLVSLGRERKRQLRAAVHHWFTGKLNSEERARLAGDLAYVNSVEPTFLVRLRERYGIDSIERIREGR